MYVTYRGGSTPPDIETTDIETTGGVAMARARADRRADMLRTAAAMFAESGFHGVSMDDLGARLGVSGPALYRYFPGKESILAEMLVDVSERLLAGARECVTEQPTPRDRLSALVDFHVAFALAEPNLIAVQYRDLASSPERERRQVRLLQRQYVDLWAATLRDVYPTTSPERARACVQAAFGLLNSTPYARRSDDRELSALLSSMALAALTSGCTTSEGSSAP